MNLVTRMAKLLDMVVDAAKEELTNNRQTMKMNFDLNFDDLEDLSRALDNYIERLRDGDAYQKARVARLLQMKEAVDKALNELTLANKPQTVSGPKKAPTLFDVMEIEHNTLHAIIFKFTKDRDTLRRISYLNGDEEAVKVTKSPRDAVDGLRNCGDHTVTVYTTDGRHYSWEWGLHGSTRVCDRMDKFRKALFDVIEQQFDTELCPWKGLTTFVQSKEEL